MRAKYREAALLGAITAISASNAYVWKAMMPFSDFMPIFWGALAGLAGVWMIVTLALPRGDDPL